MKITYTMDRIGGIEVYPVDAPLMPHGDHHPCVFVQVDYDYPGIASTFGFVPCPDCNETDGTIDCEHRTATEMINLAYDFLREHEGEMVDDPGYF